MPVHVYSSFWHGLGPPTCFSSADATKLDVKLGIQIRSIAYECKRIARTPQELIINKKLTLADMMLIFPGLRAACIHFSPEFLPFAPARFSIGLVAVLRHVSSSCLRVIFFGRICFRRCVKTWSLFWDVLRFQSTFIYLNKNIN